MGGFGSGGRRSGAGRKPKAKHLRLIDGGADRRGAGADPPDEPPPASTPVSVEPPSSLSAAARAIWNDWAPAAHEAGTLTPTTRHSFAGLCELAVACRELESRLQVATDVTTGQPRALLRMSEKQEMAVRREYRNVSREVHQRQKDFLLAPFGRELVPAGATPDADPLEAFTR